MRRGGGMRLGVVVAAAALAGLACGKAPARSVVHEARAADHRADPAADSGVLRNPDARATPAPEPGTRRFPVAASACALDGAGKTLSWQPHPRLNRMTFFSRPEIRKEEEEKNGVPFTRLTEGNSAVFGKLVLLQDGVRGMYHSELGSRTYALGQSVVDACGSIVYTGENALPRFSTDPDPIHGTESAVARLTLEDHRGRAKSCPTKDATMVLHEETVVNGKPVLKRTLFASGVKPSPRPPRLASAPVCAFFDKPGQVPDREPGPCEVGTYFLEDDAPLGKIVELRDWIDGRCRERKPAALGRRLYVLEPGKSDTCGTIRYGIGALAPEEGYYPRDDTVGLGLKFTYALGIIDNRFRKHSPRCPPATSQVELVERAFNTSDGPPVLERRFYAPRADR